MHISKVSGHRNASLAIELALNKLSEQTKTLSLNAFNYVYPLGEKIVNQLYMLIILRLPFIWAYLYDNPAWEKRTRRIKKFIHRYNFKKIRFLFERFEPDAVVATQAFPCGIVADFKKVYSLDLPLVAVLTDFTAHSYWIYDRVDYYVVPGEELKQVLIQKGVDPGRIKVLGIPVDPKFRIALSKTQARKKLNLEKNLFTILITGGGHGIGPIKEGVRLIEGLNFDLQLIVACGTNRPLWRWLKKRLCSYKKKIIIFEYAENMQELMAAADIIVTKPGGITCAEALARGLPMVILAPIPGQETSNAAYLIKKGAAVKAAEPADLMELISGLYNDPDRLNKLSANALSISRPNAADDIAKLLLEL